MPTLDTRPGKLDVVLRPGNTLTLVMHWPDDLTGRTFTATTDGHTLPTEVDGTVLRVTFPAAVTALLDGRKPWTLSEGQQVLVTGRALLSMGGTESPVLEVTVSTSEAQVTVVAGPAAGASPIPDPSGQPDGAALVVKDGQLVYSTNVMIWEAP